MSVRIGINGFGRMGRLGLRAGWGFEDVEFAHINEIATDAAGAAHLLKFDSVHGTWDRNCHGEGNELFVNAMGIGYTSNATIPETDWSGCDIVIEATGKHHKKSDALQGYFDQGVKKVLVAAPTEGALNIVYGVNDHLYNIAGRVSQGPGGGRGLLRAGQSTGLVVPGGPQPAHRPLAHPQGPGRTASGVSRPRGRTRAAGQPHRLPSSRH